MTKNNLSQFWPLIPIGLTQIFVLSKIQFTPWPEMLLWPWLVSHGWIPFSDIIVAHALLLYMSLALWYRVMGTGLVSLKIFTWSYIFLTAIILWVIAAKQSGKKTATISIAFYALLQTVYQGNGMWFDLGLAPLVLLAYYFLKSHQPVFAGVFFAVALFTKQTAFWLIIPVLWEIHIGKSAKHFFISLTAMSLAILTSIAITGSLDDFYRWAVQAGVFNLSRSQWQSQWPAISTATVFLTLPVAAAVLSPQLTPWILFASMGVLPRWELFHFQPAIPFVALGLAQASIRNKKLFIVLLIFACLLYFKVIIRDWNHPDRFFDTDTLLAAQFIQANSRPQDTLYVFNYWDNLYLLSGRLPAIKPFVPGFPIFLDAQGIQEAIVSDLQDKKPPYVVFHPLEASGYGSYRPQIVWRFLTQNYTLYTKISDQVWILKRNN